MEFDLESGFRVRISSQGLLTIYKKFPENQSSSESKWNTTFWVVPAESFREQCSKFRLENEMVPFRKLKKTTAVIRRCIFFTILRSKLIGHTLY